MTQQELKDNLYFQDLTSGIFLVCFWTAFQEVSIQMTNFGTGLEKTNRNIRQRKKRRLTKKHKEKQILTETKNEY